MSAPNFLGLVCFILATVYTVQMVRDWRRNLHNRKARRLIERMEARP